LDDTRHKELLGLAISAAVEAGKLSMYYFKNTQNKVRIKKNLSPVTLADEEANRVIAGKLSETGINIISEESKIPKYKIRKNWEEVWVVDPIDGTREFINGGNDFTVNIALVSGNETRLGVIYLPASGELYYGIVGIGAFKHVLGAHEFFEGEMLQNRFSISPDAGETRIRIVATRSNYNNQTKKLINKIQEKFGDVEIIRRSSSLKFCLLAEGKANLFLRLNTINEWDTAAGQAIVEASGCFTSSLKKKSPILYNKKNMTSPGVIIAGSEKIIVNLSHL
jgi:3'(2'), 5'-bisphosphate nucleotidase